MTKAEITERIHEKIGCSKSEAAQYLESVLSLMKSTLESGEDVKISGFGKFTVKDKKPRKGRNPQTGDSLILAGRRVLTFKPSVLLRDAVNKRG